ncbi:MAG: efflux RND transporter periplasmic adaptor subunit [Halioglobus sp.]|nr:efflux RND transporter periplasmic adaptor subunit [Halioglobus sp.]
MTLTPLIRRGGLALLVLLCLAHAAALAQPAGVPVKTEQVREQAVQRQVDLTGTVTSPNRARLSTATSGLVTALQVDAGSRVAEGDVLLELDGELADWQWRGARADVEAARLALEDARRRLREAQTLAPRQSIAETAVRDLEAEVAEDEAALQRASAEAGYREGLLERHRLRAPFAGVISARMTDLGEWVTPGTPVLTLVATDSLRLDFPVAEEYLGAITGDAGLSYHLGGAGGERRAAAITVIVPVSESGARTFLLRGRPSDEDARLTPGRSVHGVLTLSTGRREPVVPRDALLRYPDGRNVVWVVEKGPQGTVAQERQVRTGLVFSGRVEILEGLDPGELVVVEGNESLQVGQPVSVLGEADR